jgi:hypothetical protein
VRARRAGVGEGSGGGGRPLGAWGGGAMGGSGCARQGGAKTGRQTCWAAAPTRGLCRPAGEVLRTTRDEHSPLNTPPPAAPCARSASRLGFNCSAARHRPTDTPFHPTPSPFRWPPRTPPWSRRPQHAPHQARGGCRPAPPGPPPGPPAGGDQGTRGRRHSLMRRAGTAGGQPQRRSQAP